MLVVASQHRQSKHLIFDQWRGKFSAIKNFFLHRLSTSLIFARVLTLCSMFTFFFFDYLHCLLLSKWYPNKNENVIETSETWWVFCCSFQLRNGQSVCTDNECMDLTSPQNASPSSDSADSFTLMMFMMIAAVILYLIRPNSLRRRSDDLNKPSRDDVS